MLYPSKLVMRTLQLNPAIRTFCIHGFFREAIIAMVCSPTFFNSAVVLILAKAALTMYQRARKLRGLMIRDPTSVSRLGSEQLEAYLISANALSLADAKNLWFLLPGSLDASTEVGIALLVNRFA